MRTPDFDSAHPDEYVIALATAKAKAGRAPENSLILGCDTIVMHQDRLLEKPSNRNQAIEYLSLLADDWHRVYTGIALWQPSTRRLLTASEMTRVQFGPMTLKEIKSYVATGEPLDKAGAYGIQEKGALLIKELRGDYFNVVGLPLFRLTVLLTRFNIFLSDLLE